MAAAAAGTTRGTRRPWCWPGSWPPPHPPDLRAGSPPVGVPVGAEQRFLVDHPGLDGPGYPGEVDEVPGVDVLGGDVAAPGPAAEAERERQAVARAARALVEVLVHQDPGGPGGHGQPLHVRVRAGVDAAGMPEALVGGDRVDQAGGGADVTLVPVD